MSIKTIDKETGDIGELIAGGTLFADSPLLTVVSSYVKQGRVVTGQIQFWGGATLSIQINDVLYTGFPQPDRGFQFSVYNTEFSEPIVFQLNEDGSVITKETISKDSTTIGMFSYISKY